MGGENKSKGSRRSLTLFGMTMAWFWVWDEEGFWGVGRSAKAKAKAKARTEAGPSTHHPQAEVRLGPLRVRRTVCCRMA